jgi:pyruvate ferredoxin oxidoreductase gamma subunit
MLEVRIHGRGGQGNVVASYLLATAAFSAGKYSQAFPSFGAERRGAPVTAFVRLAEIPFRRRCQVKAPDFLIVQDRALLHVPEVLAGLKENGGVLVNAKVDGKSLCQELGLDIVAFPATELALELLGKPVPNTALIAAFLTLTGLFPLEALREALASRFRAQVLAANLELVEAAAKRVPAGFWQEKIHASSA